MVMDPAFPAFTEMKISSASHYLGEREIQYLRLNDRSLYALLPRGFHYQQ
jgi:hypothetical protein